MYDSIHKEYIIPFACCLTRNEYISVLTQYGFTFASRRVFNLFSPQRKRPCYFKMKGKWTIYDPQDGVNGLAVLGDDPALLCRNFVRDFCPGL